MARISQRRVFEDVVRHIRLGMANGSIASGERLSTERGLAASHNASRNSLREGIRILETLGLVVVKRGRDGGVFAARNCQQLARESFTALVPLGQYSFAASLEFRKMIEPRAAELAAQRATEDHHNTLRKSLAMLDEHPTSAEMFAESNRLFHGTIAAATANVYIENFVPRFFAMDDMWSAARTAGSVQRSLARFFHSRIAYAIVQGKAAEAGVWMEAHLAQLESDYRQAGEVDDNAPASRRRPRRSRERRRSV